MAVADSSDPASVRRSRYVTGFEQLHGDDTRAVARLMELARGRARPFLLATGDRYALLVARHQAVLAERYSFVTPSHARLEGIIDKSRLYETARLHGFPHPVFHLVGDQENLELAVARVPTPCYVKPALAHQWHAMKRGNLERAENPAQLRKILGQFISLGIVAIPQEIVPGDDTGVYSVCTCIAKSGECPGWRTKRKLRQWPVDAGDASMQEICNEPEVARLGLDLLAIAGHRGPATVEFRRDSRTGHFVLMEINARTILGQEMITRSGLDVPFLAYCDALDLSLPQPGQTVNVRWIYFGADFRAFRRLRRLGRLTTFGWLRSLLPCRAFAFLAFDDPGPFLSMVRNWIRRMWPSTALAGAARR